METNLVTSVGQIHLERPVMLASGILGISLDVFNRLHRSGAGAIVTKSISKEPWEGYPNPTIFGLLFIEGGNVWQDTRNFNIYDLKRSVGVGVRLFMPLVGIIGVDFGYPP